MDEFMMSPIMVAMISEEVVVDALRDSLEQYTVAPSKDSFNKLCAGCAVLIMKATVGDNIEEAVERIKEMNELRNFHQTLRGTS